MANEKTAYDITTPMIQQTGEAIRTGDFDLYMRHFAIPFVMETHEETFVFRSRYEMQQHFEGVCRYRAENNIVASRRENVSAEFSDSDTISLVHISHLLREDRSVFDRPYPTYSIIRNVGGRWLTHYCLYGVDKQDSFERALLNFQKREVPFDQAMLR